MQVERFAIEGQLLLSPGCSTISGATSSRAGINLDSRKPSEWLLESPPVLPEQPFPLRLSGAAAAALPTGTRAQGNLLVRGVAVQLFDVAVDLRRSSPTFGQWWGIRLGGTNHQQLWGPVGLAHGCLTLSETTDVLYRSSN